jgi:hypothetical protein
MIDDPPAEPLGGMSCPVAALAACAMGLKVGR